MKRVIETGNGKPYKTRSTDNRTRNRNDYRAPASQPMERVNSQNSIEDRLAYYKAKYGEDFKADDAVIKGEKKLKASGNAAPSRNRNRKPGNGSRPQGSGNQGQRRNGQGSRKSAAPAKAAPKAAVKAAPKAAVQPPKKKGLLSRLFGGK